MPPRWLGCSIVVFWLIMTGWLFWHDLWPRWMPGEPPPFHIDDVEEVQQKRQQPLRIFWIVERQEKGQTRPYPVFHASTWIEQLQEADAYALQARLQAAKDPLSQPVTVAKIFIINRLTSTYRVHRSGHLRSLEAAVDVRFNEKHPLRKLFPEALAQTPKDSSALSFSLNISGEVRDHQFFAHCRADSLFLSKPMEFDLPPVSVSYTGSVWMPLHPVNRIRGLRLGQRWRQPLVDPLRDAFAFLPEFSGSVRWLNARVQPQPAVLNIDDYETNCLVIDYTNDENELIGRTWVEEEGERVLQQEAVLGDSRWIMKRELPRKGRLPLLDF